MIKIKKQKRTAYIRDNPIIHLSLLQNFATDKSNCNPKCLQKFPNENSPFRFGLFFSFVAVKSYIELDLQVIPGRGDFFFLRKLTWRISIRLTQYDQFRYSVLFKDWRRALEFDWNVLEIFSFLHPHWFCRNILSRCLKKKKIQRLNWNFCRPS